MGSTEQQPVRCSSFARSKDLTDRSRCPGETSYGAMSFDLEGNSQGLLNNLHGSFRTDSLFVAPNDGRVQKKWRKVTMMKIIASLAGMVAVASFFNISSSSENNKESMLAEQVSMLNEQVIEDGVGSGELEGKDYADLAGPNASQISLRVVGEVQGAWTYAIAYATSSKEAPQETACSAWPTSSLSSSLKGYEKLKGVGKSVTYSSLLTAQAWYGDPKQIYTSPYLHRCEISGLKPQSSYSYSAGAVPNGKVFTFVTPPLPNSSDEAFPFTFVVIADVGQTNFSEATFEAVVSLIDSEPSMKISTLLLPGDLSYADGDQRRWDRWGWIAEPLLSRVDLIAAVGNHELEKSENNVAYQKRYAPGELWHMDLRGPVAFITLSSYSNFQAGSAQYRWLERELESLDRSVTPWVVVQAHAPLYSSSLAHKGEYYWMRAALEDLFALHKVALVFSGHVHAYERTLPIYKRKNDPCGTTYITVGDGGNREGLSTVWAEPSPAWSAYRKSEYGFGYLTVQSPTVAEWTWHSDSVAVLASGLGREATDTVVIDRSACRQ